MTEKTLMNRWSYRKYWNYNGNLIRPFAGSDTITHNYSESDQDIFVLSMLNGLRNGTYLELGAAWPHDINNTALLSERFGWTGISVDKNNKLAPLWERAGRKFISADAIHLNYSEVLSDMPKVIDYLSIDCDPSIISFNVLRKVPFDTHQFRVITFEHDSYRDDGLVKLASRKYLESKGYKLVANNISTDSGLDYEDWYVHPNLVDPNRLTDHMSISDQSQLYRTYLYHNRKYS